MYRARKNYLRGLMITLLGLAIAGCESGVTDPPSNDPPDNPAPQMPSPENPNPPSKPPAKDDEQPADPSGVWKHESGPFASWEYNGATWQGEYFVLRPDGSFRMVVAEISTGALYCYNGIYVAIDDVMLLSFDWGDQEQFLFNEDSFVIYSLPNDDTLSFKSSGGELTAFSRQAELPAAYNCGEMETIVTFANLDVVPDYYAGLAYDGNVLWFTDDNTGDVTPIDPDTAVPGAPIALTDARYVHAVQDADFWVHDGDSEAQRRSKGNVKADSIDVYDDFGIDMELESLAFNPTTQTLWLYGFDYDESVYRLLAVDAGAEPDVLLSNSVLGLELSGITWDGSYLWALEDETPTTIYQVHPRTLKVLVSYQLKDQLGPYTQYTGIASAGDSLFLIGADYNGKATGILTEVKPAE